jgi:hypothetical protein
VAATIHVPGDYATISEALAVAVSGDIVLLAEGLHYESNQVNMRAGVRLIGAGTYETVKVRIRGIRVVWPAEGDSSLTAIENIHFESIDDATPILAVRGNPFTTVRNCRFYTNQAIVFQGGGKFEHNWVIKPDVFDEEDSFAVIEGVWGVPGELYVAWNEFLLGSGGLVIHPREWVTKAEIDHNTFVYPGWPPFPTPGYFDYGAAEFRVSNNIFWGVEHICSDFGELGGSIVYDYNCFWPWINWPQFDCHLGVGGFEANPLFCDIGDPWFWDWRLDPNSPCIGTGEGGTNIGAREIGCKLVPVLPPPDGDYPAAPLGLTLLMPNPFTPPLRVRCAVPPPGVRGRVDVFDPAGRQVRTLADGWLRGDMNSWTWDGRGISGDPVSSGTYFVRLQTGQGSVTQRVLLIR